MASNKWTPVYEYKRTFMENVYMCFLFLLAHFILCGGIILITSINNIIAGSILGIFAICLFVLSYLEYTLPNRTKNKWRDKGVEYFNRGFIPGYISLKTGKNLIGLYEKNTFLFEPIYNEIKRSENFLLIKNIENKWGVYNIQLSKFILPCEYVSLKEKDGGNLLAVKDRIRYEFSPYGSIVCKENLMDKFTKKMETLVNN